VRFRVVRFRVVCPRCRHEFEAVPHALPHQATRRGIAAVDAPVREEAPTCAICGLVRALHEGGDRGENLAWARYGCDAFVERGSP
jgi:hypothetical protein